LYNQFGTFVLILSAFSERITSSTRSFVSSKCRAVLCLTSGLIDDVLHHHRPRDRSLGGRDIGPSKHFLSHKYTSNGVDRYPAFQVAVTGFGLVSMFFYCLLGASTPSAFRFCFSAGTLTNVNPSLCRLPAFQPQYSGLYSCCWRDDHLLRRIENTGTTAHPTFQAVAAVALRGPKG
jgi:hypothetical protein